MKLFPLLFLIVFASCDPAQQFLQPILEHDFSPPAGISLTTGPKAFPAALSGYNMRWRDTPDFEDTNVMALMDSLHTKMFRYPGGTAAHDWNWQTGLPYSNPQNAVKHPVQDVKKLADATGAKVTFVLDIINRTLEDQINMLQAAAMPIEFIEMGNELYSQDYDTIFPTGAAYADKVNAWVPQLRETFPDAKIGVVMLGRYVGPGNPRNNTWNTDVHNNLKEKVDAYIYHIYLSDSANDGEGETVEERLARFKPVFIQDMTKETWITEYGDKQQDYFKTLDLAERLYREYHATLLLNHCFIAKSGDFTKIEPVKNNDNTYTFTREGLEFLAYFNPNVARGTQPYLQSFELENGAAALPDPGYKAFALPDQTIDARVLPDYYREEGNFAGADQGAAVSNNGILLYYDHKSAVQQDMDNLLVSPYFPATHGNDTLQLDLAYSFPDVNTAKVTILWSETYKGSGAFNPSEWKALGPPITTEDLFRSGYKSREFKRLEFLIQAKTGFYIALRFQQTFRQPGEKTLWRVDNIEVR